MCMSETKMTGEYTKKRKIGGLVTKTKNMTEKFNNKWWDLSGDAVTWSVE